MPVGAHHARLSSFQCFMLREDLSLSSLAGDSPATEMLRELSSRLLRLLRLLLLLRLSPITGVCGYARSPVSSARWRQRVAGCLLHANTL
jgi:hypothetical protein